jgi:hypothetical protein
LRGAEFRGVGEYFDETAGDASEKAAWGVVGEAAAKHLQNVLGGLDRVDQASQIRTRWGSGGDGERVASVWGERGPSGTRAGDPVG